MTSFVTWFKLMYAINQFVLAFAHTRTPTHTRQVRTKIFKYLLLKTTEQMVLVCCSHLDAYIISIFDENSMELQELFC